MLKINKNFKHFNVMYEFVKRQDENKYNRIQKTKERIKRLEKPPIPKAKAKKSRRGEDSDSCIDVVD